MPSTSSFSTWAECPKTLNDRGERIAVFVLVARSKSIDDLRPLAPRILEALANAKHGRVTLVGG
jgi:hypothetical protein